MTEKTTEEEPHQYNNDIDLGSETMWGRVEAYCQKHRDDPAVEVTPAPEELYDAPLQFIGARGKEEISRKYRGIEIDWGGLIGGVVISAFFLWCGLGTLFDPTPVFDWGNVALIIIGLFGLLGGIQSVKRAE